MRHLAGFKAHWITKDGNGILSKKNTLFKYNFNKNSFEMIWRFSYQNIPQRIFNNSIIERLLRGGIHHVLIINGNYVVFFDKKIITMSKSKIKSIFHIDTCKRPLNVCYNYKNGNIYWGDYIAGSSRKHISIYHSNDYGQNWDIIHTFQAGQIRHIHNIIYDQYKDHYWILTGDTDYESSILRTKDFTDIKTELEGSQKYRATSLIPTPDGLIIPTDTEIEKNHIQFYSYENNKLKSVTEISSSAIGARRINDISFVSTMVEPSVVNKSKNVKIYASKNNHDWYQLLSFKKDILPGKYFQYPAIDIPVYDLKYSSDNYYFNVRNTKINSGVIIISKKEILDTIKNKK